MKLSRIFIALVVLFICNTTLAKSTNEDDVTEIKKVIEAFRVSIIDKDKQTFKSLFYSESIPWIAVFSDEMLNIKRKIKPNYPRSVDFGKFGPPVKMISDDEEQEEKMWNIKVESDGYLGSVHFNYSDHRNGVKKAFGTEAWDLVKGDSGWKIVSIKYTVTEVL
ncbi:hypothetical protein SOPP22_12565 [Shewanella sp. OPT22]|nr:hypothetical protein SOPP22_12565 [Shewanella sp. OPT22]